MRLCKIIPCFVAPISLSIGCKPNNQSADVNTLRNANDKNVQYIGASIFVTQNNDKALQRVCVYEVDLDPSQNDKKPASNFNTRTYDLNIERTVRNASAAIAGGGILMALVGETFLNRAHKISTGGTWFEKLVGSAFGADTRGVYTRVVGPTFNEAMTGFGLQILGTFTSLGAASTSVASQWKIDYVNKMLAQMTDGKDHVLTSAQRDQFRHILNNNATGEECPVGLTVGDFRRALKKQQDQKQ